MVHCIDTRLLGECIPLSERAPYLLLRQSRHELIEQHCFPRSLRLGECAPFEECRRERYETPPLYQRHYALLFMSRDLFGHLSRARIESALHCADIAVDDVCRPSLPCMVHGEIRETLQHLIE
jgi:hypothetical protein